MQKAANAATSEPSRLDPRLRHMKGPFSTSSTTEGYIERLVMAGRTASRSGSARRGAKRWVSKVHTASTYPPKGLFTKSAATIARVLASRKVSPKGPGIGDAHAHLLHQSGGARSEHNAPWGTAKSEEPALRTDQKDSQKRSKKICLTGIAFAQKRAQNANYTETLQPSPTPFTGNCQYIDWQATTMHIKGTPVSGLRYPKVRNYAVSR